jgi:Major tropism determinant N-terminal domain
MPRNTDIRPRRGTLAQWTAANPTLGDGEFCYETDTGSMKVGDGVTPWNLLSYYRPNVNGLTQMSDDVPFEVTFDVNRIAGAIGTQITVPTYLTDAAKKEQTTHPSVLYFPEGWGAGKWKYWLAHTPYPQGNDDYEDPSISVSNNGISWQDPIGVTNPLADATGQPEYHSDVDLKMGPNNTMYLFYRWAASVDNGGTEEQFRYMSSKDGVNWTTPTIIHVTDQDITRIMSPSFVYENNGWTFWGVDIFTSPNRVVRRKSVGNSILSGWGAIEYPSIPATPSGKEPWHIYMIKYAGRYFGLLNTCDVDQNGANGQLHFLQSYDGFTFEMSTQTVIPSSAPGLYDQLYRSTMFPAFENGVFGFRVIYIGWLDSGPTWHVFRTFLRPGSSLINTPVDTNIYTVLSPSSWSNRGTIAVKDIGAYKQYCVDFHIERAAGSANLSLANTFISCGLVVPTAIRAVANGSNVAKYFPGWLSGGGFNLPVQMFINFWSGEVMIRQQSGTAVNMVAGVGLDIAFTWNIPYDVVPVGA